MISIMIYKTNFRMFNSINNNEPIITGIIEYGTSIGNVFVSIKRYKINQINTVDSNKNAVIFL